MEKRLPSERVVVASPMSMAGAWQRSMRLAEHGRGVENQWLRLVARTCWWSVALTLGVLWALVALAWSVGMFLLFGVFFVVWRIFRRGSRNRRAEQLRHRELLDAVERRKPS